jgi:peroxiredoxin
MMFLCSLLTEGCSRSHSTERVNFPFLSLRDLQGTPHELADSISQKITVIAFWTTGCAPCRLELRLLEELFRQYGKQGLVAFAIALDGPEMVASLRPLVKQQGWTFTVLWDREMRATAIYNPRQQVPMMLIFDRRGRLVYAHSTYQPAQLTKVRSTIAELLGKNSVD